MKITRQKRREIAKFAAKVCRRHGYPKRKTPLYRDLMWLVKNGKHTRDNVARAIMKHLPITVQVEKEKKRKQGQQAGKEHT